MGNEGKLILFWVCIVTGIIDVGVGVGLIFQEGYGWVTAGILCFIMIPVGLEFNNKFLK